MAKRHKDFGRVATVDDYEPLSFTLEGQDFECRAALNGTTLLKFVREADSGEGGRSADALLGLFKTILLEEDYKRFDALVNDPDVIIRIDVLGDIASWAIEEYTKRPTQGQSNSSSGLTVVGNSSTGTVSAGDSN